MRHRISEDGLAAIVSDEGGELISLTDRRGAEYIWQAGPQWPRRAPVLFPIVGRLNADTLRHEGESYRLPQHGFARDSRFAWIEREASACRLALEDCERSRASFPFRFRLELSYRFSRRALAMGFRVVNPADEVLPVSFGAHPAFNWPLAHGLSPEDYALTFEREEPAPARRLAGGLLRPERVPSPVEGRSCAFGRRCSTRTRSFSTRSKAASCALRRRGGRESKFRGADSASSASGPSRERRSFASNPGRASPARSASTGRSRKSPASLLIPPGEATIAELEIRPS